MKKFLSLALALIMVLSLVACGDTASDNTDNSNTDANTEQTGEIKGLTAEERAKEFITVGTGPTSGIYFPIGGAFATALKEYGYQTSAEATNATGQNIQNILNGDAEIAIAMQDAVMQAYTGTGAYEGKGEASDLRADAPVAQLRPARHRRGHGHQVRGRPARQARGRRRGELRRGDQRPHDPQRLRHHL